MRVATTPEPWDGAVSRVSVRDVIWSWALTAACTSRREAQVCHARSSNPALPTAAPATTSSDSLAWHGPWPTPGAGVTSDSVASLSSGETAVTDNRASGHCVIRSVRVAPTPTPQGVAASSVSAVPLDSRRCSSSRPSVPVTPLWPGRSCQRRR